MLLDGGEDYEITAEFENAGQLVKGNEVVVGGAAAGSVKGIELGPESQALVTFSVDEEYAPLQRGTVATIRSPSLSQIAGRQVQLTLPVDSRGGRGDRERRHPEPVRDGLRGRPRSALQHPRPGHDQGLQARDPGPRDVV